mmetsp:Transcript_49909/g.129534  ORF Transcript_49909/g.129534 Transcript_49909/m.129534 type:complete len:359 (+) Transcript_49909:53-1129(+)
MTASSVFFLTAAAIQVYRATSVLFDLGGGSFLLRGTQPLCDEACEKQREGANLNRYAIAMYGGVTGLRGKFSQDGVEKDGKSTVNLSIPAIMLKENIVGAPGQPFPDVFMHSWSPYYKKTFERLYHPKLAKYEYNVDDMPSINTMAARLPRGHLHGDYPDIGHVSMTRSMSKVLSMIADYQEETGHVYDSIYLCRPDVFLRGKVDLNLSANVRYDPLAILPQVEGQRTQRHGYMPIPAKEITENTVFHTAGISRRADFHYLFSGRHARTMSTIFDSLPNLSKPILAHSGWMEEFLSNAKLRLVPADTVADYDEEVYRKLEDTPQWRSYLAWAGMPSQCIDQLLQKPPDIRDECLVDLE